MLSSRYGNIDFVLDLDFEDGELLISKAYEKRSEERAWQLYLTKYGDMTEESYIPFDRFYNPKRIEEGNESAEDILADVKELLNSTEWG